MFLGAVMFSITLPSMVFFYDIVNGSVYAENRDEDGDIIALDSIGFYSLIVASFSVGQAVASPPFGWWFNRSGARQPYVAGLIFLTAGSLIYAMATNQVGSPRPSARRCVGGADDLWPCPERAPRRGGHGAAANRTQWMLVIARFLGGLGAGTATVARAHVGAATDLAHSTGAMALVAGTSARRGATQVFPGPSSAANRPVRLGRTPPSPPFPGAQAVGLVGGPAFALAFTSVNVDMGGGFYFDQYTAPGYLSAALGLINLALIMFFFVEAPTSRTLAQERSLARDKHRCPLTHPALAGLCPSARFRPS